jgi:hypothetical protein
MPAMSHHLPIVALLARDRVRRQFSDHGRARGAAVRRPQDTIGKESAEQPS